MSTLIGAVVGGLATFGGAWVGQDRVEKLEREKSEQKAADAALISARILQGELAWAEARVMQALRTGKYWSERYGLKEEAWLDQREQIAVALDGPDEWARVRDGFRSLRTLELQASRRRRDQLSRPEVSDWGKKELERGLQRIRRAIKALQPVARDWPRESLASEPGRPEDEPTIDQPAEAGGAQS